MNIELAVNLSQFSSGSFVFLRTEPEVIDFARNESKVKIHLLSEDNELHFDLDSDYEVMSLLQAAIFDNKISVLGWNIKGFFTYAFYKTGMLINFDKQPFDLKVAESFIGLKQKCPKDFSEVKERLKTITSSENWSKLKKLYSKIYLPLITKVIPSIEAEGLVDLSSRQKLYCYYDIDGTSNGRMSCHIPGKGYFNPHSLSKDQKANLVPFGGADTSFIYFDFHYMEVCMLAWLSKDEYLKQLIDDKEDFYKKLFTILSGKECNTENKREIAKNIFLPVIYGEGPGLLSEKIGVNEKVAERLIQKLKSEFKKLFSWIDDYEHSSYCFDYFGRKRYFEDDKRYKYRNFIIQAPAALVCLERLICLHRDLDNYAKIVAHIHDGYIIKSSDKQLEMTKSIAEQSLQSESEICPGLKFITNYKIGKNLP